MDEDEGKGGRDVKISATSLGNEPVAHATKYAVFAAIVVAGFITAFGSVGIEMMSNFLYDFTQWLYGTPLNDFAQAVSESALSGLVLSWFWAIPIMQTIHILAIAASLAAVLMINLRVFGLASGNAALNDTARRYMRILWLSLIFVVLTGVAMLFGDTVRNLLNSIFWIKMGLIVVGILLSIAFASNLGRYKTAGDAVSGGTKAFAIFLAILWCVIILCGRWIAYAPS